MYIDTTLASSFEMRKMIFKMQNGKILFGVNRQGRGGRDPTKSRVERKFVLLEICCGRSEGNIVIYPVLAAPPPPPQSLNEFSTFTSTMKI